VRQNKAFVIGAALGGEACWGEEIIPSERRAAITAHDPADAPTPDRTRQQTTL
jgi:hypothetical protein